jgi:hypothetical protein
LEGAYFQLTGHAGACKKGIRQVPTGGQALVEKGISVDVD